MHTHSITLVPSALPPCPFILSGWKRSVHVWERGSQNHHPLPFKHTHILTFAFDMNLASLLNTVHNLVNKQTYRIIFQIEKYIFFCTGHHQLTPSTAAMRTARPRQSTNTFKWKTWSIVTGVLSPCRVNSIQKCAVVATLDDNAPFVRHFINCRVTCGILLTRSRKGANVSMDCLLAF